MYEFNIFTLQMCWFSSRMYSKQSRWLVIEAKELQLHRESGSVGNLWCAPSPLLPILSVLQLLSAACLQYFPHRGFDANLPLCLYQSSSSVHLQRQQHSHFKLFMFYKLWRFIQSVCLRSKAVRAVLGPGTRGTLHVALWEAAAVRRQMANR